MEDGWEVWPLSAAEIEQLGVEWQELLVEFGVGEQVAKQLFEELRECYAEPGRYYHTLGHVRQVLATVHELAGQALDKAALLLAAWYHDVIYNSRAADNEEQSAAYARRALGAAGLPAATIEHTAALIMATKTHVAGDDPDARILLDADLAAFAADPADFRRQNDGIRYEYSWVADDAYRAGRIDVLRRFLAREHIFLTPAMQAREPLAKHNLAAEIALMEQG